jgi:predicted chitinase
MTDDWRNVVRSCAPHADPHILDAIARNADRDFAKWKINTPLRQAHLFCHMDVESKGFTKLEENLNYKAERICQVWPSRFPTIASAEPYAHNPRALANNVYGSRMGNRPGTDDGWNNRGQGLLETTGHNNIAKLAKVLEITPEQAAVWLTHPDHMLECACANFVLNGCLPYAGRDELPEETHHVNGGEEGLARRESSLKRFKRALGVPLPVGLLDDDPFDVPEAEPVMPAEQVRAIQRQLKAKGYFPGAIDGDFSVSTTGAISELQHAEGLPVTGKLDPRTQNALWSDGKRPIGEARANASEGDLADEPEIEDSHAANGSLNKVVASGGGAAAIAGASLKDTVFGWFGAHKDSILDSFEKFKDAKAQVTETAPGLLPWVSAHAAEIAIALLVLLTAYALVEFFRHRAATRRIRRRRVFKHNTNADRSR